MLFTVSAVQPYDIWRDSIWQFLGVVVALIIGIPGLFISIRGLLQQRNLKRLDYEIINDTPILDVQQDSKVKIEVNDKQVRNLRLVFLKIRNTGNVPIKEEDFVEPLAFKFRSGAEVLDSKIEEVIPSNLKPSLTVDSQSVTLKPLLLNPKDTIKLKMLLSGSNEKIEGEVRIAGI